MKKIQKKFWSKISFVHMVVIISPLCMLNFVDIEPNSTLSIFEINISTQSNGLCQNVNFYSQKRRSTILKKEKEDGRPISEFLIIKKYAT
jgi:hypothetical protein